MTKMLRHLLLLALLCLASIASAQSTQRYTLGDTIDIEFTTIGDAGAPATLAGTPTVAVFRGSGTTALTSGVTLTVDAGSVTGLNKVRILTSDSSFVPDVDYSVRLTAGETDVSLVGATVGRFRLSRAPPQSHLTPAQRLLDGRSVVGGIGDSYMSPSASWRSVSDWDIAYSGPRMRMRGESLLMDGQNPFSTKGADAQAGIRNSVLKGATYPGTALTNRLPWTHASAWNGSLANGTTFTVGNFGNDSGANTGLYRNPNLLPYDIGAIDTWVSYIGGSHNVSSLRILNRRDVSVGAVGSSPFNPTTVTGYTSNHTTLTAMAGTGGTIDALAQLQVTMTSKQFLQLGYGWVAKDQPLGIVYGPVIGLGGGATADFATSSGGLLAAYTDDQIHAWFEAAAASGYPIDILRVNLGTNEPSLSGIDAIYLQLLERWISIGQQYTDERFGILAYTIAPWISNGTDKTDAAATISEQIADAVEQFGDPLRVQLVDVNKAMVEMNGPVTTWGPLYMQQTGSTYLHPNTAGGPVFGAAAYRALEDAAADIQPTVKRAVERLEIPAAAVTAINADATQTTARTNAATAATNSDTLTGRLTSGRAAKLDSLLDSGSVASSDQVIGSGTVTAEEISAKRTWIFAVPSGDIIAASNYVQAKASQAGPVTVCFDLNNVIPSNAVVSSITSATISSSGATVGTAVKHTSNRKVNIPLTSITATTGNYTVTLTVVATDSEQYVVTGTLQVR
jgi:lysophospholipase L1-like esterase